MLFRSHDLFWEILKLWEKDEKARADADLTAVADWLLFSAGLWKDPNLGDPVYGRVPALAPALGDKLMDRRLAGWAAALQSSATGAEPWAWADFPGMDRKALAAAAGRLMKSGPKNNPLARVWMAALLAACDDPKGPEELSAARAALEKDLPSRAAQIDAALVGSLSGAGVRACLPLVLDQAEAELSGKAAQPVDSYGRALPTDYRYSGGRGPGFGPLIRFHQLVGWPVGRLSSGPADAKAELATARTWLKDNHARLSWDARSRRFTGGAPRPGMEKLEAAAAAVEKKWKLAVADRLFSGQTGHYGALQELVALMEGQPEAVKDPAVADLFFAILDDAGSSLSSHGSGDALRARLARLNPELAGRYLAAGVRTMLASRNSSGIDYYFQSLASGETGDAKGTLALLAPEMKKFYAEAAKGDDRERKLQAAIACLYTGGKLDSKELAAVVAGAPAASGSSGESSLAVRAMTMARCGRPGGLRLLLAVGRKDIGRYAAEGVNHPVRQFGHLAGWYDQRETPPAGTAEEELAAAEAWLDKHESELVWDRNRGRFTGAPSPAMEEVAAAAGAIKERWGLSVGDALAGGGRDSARRLFSEIIALMEKKPEAAADAGLAALALAMIEPGRLDDGQDEILRERLYVRLPRLNRGAGVKAWTMMLRRRLLQTDGGAVRDPSALNYLVAGIKGYDPTLVAEAARALLPELRKFWEGAPADRFEDRVGRAMAFVYAGGELPKDDLDKLLAEADKLGSSGYARLNQWAQPIAQAGNLAGLRLMLQTSRSSKAIRSNALGQFDYMVGRKTERYGGDYYRLTDEQQIERVDAALTWLEENAGNLEFQPAEKRYKLKVEAKPPAPAPTPGPTPKPKDPKDPKDPEVF